MVGFNWLPSLVRSLFEYCCITTKVCKAFHVWIKADFSIFNKTCHCSCRCTWRLAAGARGIIWHGDQFDYVTSVLCNSLFMFGYMSVTAGRAFWDNDVTLTCHFVLLLSHPTTFCFVFYPSRHNGRPARIRRFGKICQGHLQQGLWWGSKLSQWMCTNANSSDRVKPNTGLTETNGGIIVDLRVRKCKMLPVTSQWTAKNNKFYRLHEVEAVFPH